MRSMKHGFVDVRNELLIPCYKKTHMTTDLELPDTKLQ